ncbi:hypothetical protein HM1_0391 [Heliomicrobium modesticaldum Ice1]|uniref:Uncharacterized protein n=1 Tax=Heliobacterium modesticaldum (strain ATCC 51547 / Ice1) TaxID=498761 RepID=B0TF27_HELMI|nr:hypothetical protein [Heliomicrobium modesticaldum]ABZ83010.1 hypothetical protein HM1_0391 [Heliomicrobium modesticaldum Ice1]
MEEIQKEQQKNQQQNEQQKRAQTDGRNEIGKDKQKSGLNVELMRKIIEEKRQKSANQGHTKKGKAEGGPVSARPGIKKYKKGGLFDK